MSETAAHPVDEIAASQIAEGMSREQIERLCRHCEFRTYEDGDMILKDEDRSHSLVVLLEGRAQVQGVFMQEISSVDAGNLLGELSFLDKKPRSATVRSKGHSVCAILTEEGIEALRADDPEVMGRIFHNLALSLAKKLRSTTRMMNALSLHL